MRSGLEATYAGILDHNGRSWEYEPRGFANESDHYVPDFRTRYGTQVIYVETKPAPILDDVRDLDRALARLRIIHASEPEAWLRLVVLSWEGSGVGYRLRMNFTNRDTLAWSVWDYATRLRFLYVSGERA
jgi:hypothetical protein